MDGVLLGMSPAWMARGHCLSPRPSPCSVYKPNSGKRITPNWTTVLGSLEFPCVRQKTCSCKLLVYNYKQERIDGKEMAPQHPLPSMERRAVAPRQSAENQSGSRGSSQSVVCNLPAASGGTLRSRRPRERQSNCSPAMTATANGHSLCQDHPAHSQQQHILNSPTTLAEAQHTHQPAPMKTNNAFEEDVVLCDMGGSTPPAPGSSLWNGHSVRSSTLLHHVRRHNGLFREGDQLPPELAYLQIPEDEYRDAAGHIEGCAKVRYYRLLYNRWLQGCWLLLTMLAVWLVGLTLCVSGILPSVRLAAAIFFLAGLAALLLTVITFHLLQSRMNRQAQKLLSKANTILSRRHLIVGLVEEGMFSCYRLSVHFLYFDVRPCLDTLIAELNNLMMLKCKPSRRSDSFDMSDTELVIPSRDIPDGRKHVIRRYETY